MRAESAAGDGRQPAAVPVGPQLRARRRRGRGRRRRKFGGGRSKMSQHTPRALRPSRGLPGCRGDCHGSRRCPAPFRRARRARSRAWACWASASGPRPAHRKARAGGAVSALAPAPRVRREILACAGGSRAPRAPPAPSRRAHRARARGSGAPQGVRVRRTARRGAARHPRGRSTCVPGRGEGLYVVPRPTQSRPARSARAWWACSGAPLGPRGWYPADSWNRPGVVGAEALRRAWVVLLRA